MPITESAATALVRFNGLGIIVFNKEKRRGEIAIIRDEAHELTIKVQQPRFKDGADGDRVIYEDIATYTNLPKTGVEIEIAAKGGAVIDGFEIYHADGEFDRLGSDDTNDFRWIVSMNALHDEKISSAKSPNRHPVSKLYIQNGLFYAHKLDTNLFFEKVKRDDDGSEKMREHFGNVAETIGVKIEADEVVFRIKTAETEESHVMQRMPGLPFRIEIANMNHQENAAVSDLPDYYRYLASESGLKYELEPIADSSAPGGAISINDFCHPIDGGGGGVTSIDEIV